MENVPNLFNRMTAGMDGKTTHASKESLNGATISTIFSANSSIKIKEPMKTFAFSTSVLN